MEKKRWDLACCGLSSEEETERTQGAQGCNVWLQKDRQRGIIEDILNQEGTFRIWK